MENKEQWIANQLKKLSLEEKIAQLIHIPAWSNRGSRHLEYLLKQVEDYKIGGIIFFQGTPELQLDMTQRLQAVADLPLMISIDAEWGLGMRLDNSPSFPYLLALGAIQDNQLIYDMGAEIARQCKLLGIHVNFAPVVDINSNPQNPVIGFRSFGDDKYKVAEKALAYMNGMQDHGVMACAKHFPGHGDTFEDSHFTLPIVKKGIQQLSEV
ncbi:MAG: glycoside hydrolase family 3 N-terminal domain-containing protein, partial [Bacteroidota bacterium]